MNIPPRLRIDGVEVLVFHCTVSHSGLSTEYFVDQEDHCLAWVINVILGKEHDCCLLGNLGV